MNILLSRQPIFDRDEQIAGYELSYRAQSDAPRTDDQSEEHLLVDTFVGVGLERVAEGSRVFLSTSRPLLSSGALELLSPGSVVFLVPPVGDDEVAHLDACRHLRQLGFHLATDALALPDDALLLDVVGTARVDVSRANGQLADTANRLRGRGIRLMADGVDGRDARRTLLDLGFELFHGFGSSRQESISRKDLSVDYLNTVRLMQEIQDLTIRDQQIEVRFRADIGLSYKLLRIVNSAAIGARGVDSIGHALRLLGRGPLYRWLALLLVSSGLDGGVQAEVLHVALLRARLAEMLGGRAGRPAAADSLYMVGLLSPLDILIGSTMAELLPNMGLSDEVTNALMDRSGFHGTVLRLVEAYDLGHFDEFEARCAELAIDPADVASLYLDALSWANANTPGFEG